jgi:anti-anti-sigma factor
MGTERLAVEFERRLDGSVHLRLSGKLEQGTAALLDGILQALWNDPSPVVDLSHVDHIDSRGLDVLLAAESSARRRSSPVEVVGIRESLRAHRPPLDSGE